MQRLKAFLFTNTSTKQTVAKNTLWLISSEMIVRATRFFLIIYVAKILGTEGWGLFSYSLSLIGTTLIFSDIGISFLLMKEYSNSNKRLLKTIVTLKGLLLLISSIVAVTVGFFFASLPIASLVIPVTLTLVFDSTRDFINTLLRSREKMEIEALTKTITNMIFVGFSIFLITIYKTPTALAFGYALGSFIGMTLSLVTAFGLVKKIKKDIFENKKLFIKEVFYVIIPIGVSSLITTLVLNADTVMLGIWRTPQEIGLYASGQRIFQTLMAIPGLLSIALLPKLSIYFSENKQAFKEMINNSIFVLILIAAPIAIGGMILAKPLILLLFGNTYVAASLAFSPLILGIIFAFPNQLLSSVSIVVNKQKSIAINSCIVLIITVILNLYLIPTYGIQGAAIGTTLAQLTLFILNTIVLRNNFQIKNKGVLNVLFASTSMGFVLFKLKDNNILLNISIGIFVYFFSLLMINKKPFRTIWKKV